MVIMENKRNIGTAVSSLHKWLKSFEELKFKNKIKWKNVAIIVFYHTLIVYSATYYAFPVKLRTILFAFIMYLVGGFGVTVGAHRLWCHKTFKATLPLKMITLVCFSSAGHNSLYQWVRDHRVHHKYSDSDADPHNASRGLFFSHIGWLMLKKNDEVIKGGLQVDMSDLQNDPLVRIYEKYFGWFKLVFCYALPMAISVWGLGEEWKTAATWVLIRHIAVLHATFSVNSLAHAFGYRPYNKKLKPAENHFVATVTFGEGWHNYHHAFPFDYKAAEFSDFFNFGTALIKMFRFLGLAYDLKEATPEMIAAVVARSGDGSHLQIPVDKIS